MTESSPTAAVLIIGDEVPSGRMARGRDEPKVEAAVEGLMVELAAAGIEAVPI